MTQETTSFIDQFEVPSLEELMNMYVYRSGAAVYDNLLQDQMEDFKGRAAEFELNFTEALEAIEAEIQGGATSVQRTVVIPVDIETNVDVQIDYVLDVTHKVNISVNQTLTAQYEQEVYLDVGGISWSDDPISNFSKTHDIPNDGDTWRLAMFDNDELTSFVRREGYSPNLEELTAIHGDGSVALSPESYTGDGSRVSFTITDADRAEVDTFGKAGSDYALYNQTDDSFGNFEGWAGSARNVTIVEPEPVI